MTAASGVTGISVGQTGIGLTAAGSTSQRTFSLDNDDLTAWPTTAGAARSGGSFIDLVTYDSTSNSTFDSLSLSLLRPAGDTATLSYALDYKIGASSFVTATGGLIQTMASTVTTPTPVVFDLSGITDFDMISAGTDVLFRLVVFSGTASDATSDFIFRNNSTLGVNVDVNAAFVLEGTLSAVPEPSTYAMFGSMIALGVAVYYRRKSC